MVRGTQFYMLDENHIPTPCRNVIAWGEWMADADRAVGRDIVGDGLIGISTVFLGLDHDLFGHGPPILFETMVFDVESDSRLGWNIADYQRRYHTWDEAVAGHAEAVAWAEQLAAKAAGVSIPTAAITKGE